MSLVKCRECGEQVSSGANKCPHCGCSNPGLSQKANSTIWIIALVLGAIVFIWVFSNMRSCTSEVDTSLRELDRSIQEAEKAIEDWEQEYGTP